jgi:peptidoglycan hydrolase-like protein with peptidoglycan-binding domain
MSLRSVLAFGGAAVGFVIGGPYGAQLGYTLGSVAGSVIDPQVIRGPALGDLGSQTGSEGAPRPIIFGTSPPFAGNVMDRGVTRKEWVEEGSGKGGPKTEQEHVYRTYAVRVCEGPIGGYLRVWRNGKKVYDGQDPEYTEAEGIDTDVAAAYGLDEGTVVARNLLFLNKARLFTGAWDQDVSEDLEAIRGVGTTPYYRGTAYMVMVDEDVTDMRGAIPQWTFQVTNASATPVLRNDVLDPWGDGTPYATENFHRARYFLPLTGISSPGDLAGNWYGGDSVNGGFSLAVAEGNAAGPGGFYGWTPGEYVNQLGWSPDRFAMAPAHAADAGERVSVYQHWNYYEPVYYQGVVPYWSGGSLFCQYHGNFVPPLLSVDLARTDWWSPRLSGEEFGDYDFPWSGVWGNNAVVSRAPGGGNNCVGGIVTGGGFFGHADALVEIQRVPRPPGVGAIQLVGGYKQLQAYTTQTVSGVPTVTTYPLDPVILSGSEDDTEAFWEEAYTEAVANGDMTPGLTYGVDYPVAKSYAWLVSQAAENGSARLTDIVTALVRRANIPDDMLDVTMLPEAEVMGFMVNTQPNQSVAACLQELAGIYNYDAGDWDSQIHFVPRGQDVVATITEDMMVDDGADLDEVRMLDSLAIPRLLNLNYYDVDAGGLDPSMQRSERVGDWRAQDSQSVQSSVVMTADRAATAAAVMHKVMVERAKGEVQFSLPDSSIGLTPTDAVFRSVRGKTERVVITRAELYDGYQTYTAVRDRQSAYGVEVEGIPVIPAGNPPSNVPGPTLIEVLDIPLLRDADDQPAYYIAAAGILPSWSGCVIEYSYDGGATYATLGAIASASVMGALTATLGDHPQEFPDSLNTLSVRLSQETATLLDSTLAGMMNRQNLAAVVSEDSNGPNIELVNFANADETSEGQWELSYLLRGRRATDTHEHPAGSRFIFLNRGVLLFQPAEVTDIGRTITFRATSNGNPTDTGTVVAMEFTGATRTERRAAYLSARRGGADIIVSWQGVGRLGGGAQAAHGAGFIGYRVTFEDGAIIITQDTTAQALTQDVSTLTGPVTVSVVQLNSLTGAGPSIEVIV